MGRVDARERGSQRNQAARSDLTNLAGITGRPGRAGVEWSVEVGSRVTALTLCAASALCASVAVLTERSPRVRRLLLPTWKLRGSCMDSGEFSIE